MIQAGENSYPAAQPDWSLTGLAGIVSFDGALPYPNLSRTMAERLIHPGRGTIGGEARPAPGVSLWQIGPTPPAERNGLALVLAGDIYNRRDLAAQFSLSPGLPDSSLALGLYEAQGIEGLKKINGDLVLALYDSLRRELLLFRDRFGIKPLYYALVGNQVVFASKVKTLWAHPKLKPEPDQSTLFDYLATHYRYIHRDPARTFYQGVKQVPPGHYLVITPEGESLRPYWRLELDQETARLPEAEAGARLVELLRDSVARRLDSGRKTGFSVSSGMDSSSVCSLAADLLGRPLDLYSVGYGFGEYDESEGIAPLARRYGATWHNIVLAEPPLLDTVDRLIRIADGPVCTVTWLSHFFLARAAAEDGQDVLFSGLGGDENLAGEYEHFMFFFADLKQAGLEDRLAAEVEGWIKLHDHPVFGKSWAVVEDAFRRLVDLNQPGRVRLDQARYRRYWPSFDPDFIRAGNRPPEMVNPFSSYLANRCFQDLFFETTPPCLAADHGNASHFGLTTRFPFLDYRVVEFCYSLPGTVKYDRGVTKALLRRALKGLLPESNRRNLVKTGFNAPADAWFRGAAKEDLWDLIRSRSFQDRGWFRPGAAEELFLAHQWGQGNHMMILWQMINAELWLRSLKDMA